MYSMYSMLSRFVLFGVPLLYAAYSDYKKHEIPDIITALLWVLFFTLEFFTYESLFLLGIYFTFLFSINSVFVLFSKNNKPLFGWGDILIVPPVLATLLFMLNYTELVLTLFAFSAIVTFFLFRSEEMPYAPGLCISYFIGVLVYSLQILR